MTATTEELVRSARAHAAAEAADDFETTMATLNADPVYELLPKGMALRGRAAAEAYYEHFFSTVKAMVTGHELRNEWINDGAWPRSTSSSFVATAGRPSATASWRS